MIKAQYLTKLKAKYYQGYDNFKDNFLIKTDVTDYELEKLIFNYIHKLISNNAVSLSNQLLITSNKLSQFYNRLRDFIKSPSFQTIELWRYIINSYFGITNAEDVEQLINILYRSYDKDTIFIDFVKYISERYPSISPEKLKIFSYVVTNDNVTSDEILRNYVLKLIDYIELYNLYICKQSLDPLIRLFLFSTFNNPTEYLSIDNLYKTLFEDMVIDKIKYNYVKTKYVLLFVISHLIKPSTWESFITKDFNKMEIRFFNMYIYSPLMKSLINEIGNILFPILNGTVQVAIPDDLDEAINTIINYITENIDFTQIIQNVMNDVETLFSDINYNKLTVHSIEKIIDGANTRYNYNIPNTDIYASSVPHEILNYILIMYTNTADDYIYDLFYNHKLLEHYSNKLTNRIIDNRYLYNSDDYKETFDLMTYSIDYTYEYSTNIENQVTDLIGNLRQKLENFDELMKTYLSDDKIKSNIKNEFISLQYKDITSIPSKVVFDITIDTLYNLLVGFFISPLVYDISQYIDVDIENINSELNTIVYNLINKYKPLLYTKIVGIFLGIRETISETDLYVNLDEIYNNGNNADLTIFLDSYILNPIYNKNLSSLIYNKTDDSISIDDIVEELRVNIYNYCLNNVPDNKFRYDLISGSIQTFSNYDTIKDSFKSNFITKLNFEFLKSITSIKHPMIKDVYNIMNYIDNLLYNVYYYTEELEIYYDIIRFAKHSVVPIAKTFYHFNKDINSILSGTLSLEGFSNNILNYIMNILHKDEVNNMINEELML